MRILSIETSCDESALALVDCKGGLTAPSFVVKKHLIASQIDIHRPFGGVVPNLAKREHIKNLPILLEQLKLKPADWKKIDLIAVTVAPGLEPALWTGINFAKALAKEHVKPLLGANHLEGHLYSFLLGKAFKRNTPKKTASLFPAIGLIVSGGHTVLLLLQDLQKRKKLGETRDDAVGEAFDKVARLLKLPYPGGPEIEKIAATLPANWKDTIKFPRPMLHEPNFDFSFSGLKTSILYYMRDKDLAHEAMHVADLAKAFQNAAVDVLVKKTLKAVEKFKAKSILLSGGVSANTFLRGELEREAKARTMQFHVADFVYNTDNAAMIAVSAYIQQLKGKKLPFRANGSLGIK